jgi:8-oxo-dGTP pyrophosphatase MutT (NUDIX family)
VTLAELERVLERAFAEPLPGVEAQRTMAPRPRAGWRPGRYPEDCRRGAALLLAYPWGEDASAHVLLTLRSGELVHHASQVSLPGGEVEPGESIEQAALREAREEVGVDPSSVTVLGRLTPLHVPVSRYVIHPCVAIARSRPPLAPRTAEVARVLEVPLRELCEPSHALSEARPEARLESVPFFDVAGERVWGATAMVLAEFLSLIGRTPHPRPPGGGPDD